MGIDLSRFKVVYEERVVRALTLLYHSFPADIERDDAIKHPSIIEIAIINSDGNIEVIRDKARKFQFIPILGEIT